MVSTTEVDPPKLKIQKNIQIMYGVKNQSWSQNLISTPNLIQQNNIVSTTEVDPKNMVSTTKVDTKINNL